MLIDILFMLVFGLLGVTCSVVAFRIWAQGPTEIRNLRAIGYGVRSAFKADMEKAESATTLNTKAGIELSSEDGKFVDFRRTRTISDGSL